jgi:predicted TIM-barrel fold metal-dependent hydrolase
MAMPRLAVFDAHFHIIDSRFPLVANQGYLPAPFDCRDYLERMRGYNLAGGAVVSGSFQAFDQGYLLAALQALGPSFVGITQLPATASDDEILVLDRAGVRAVRFNLKRGGSESVEHLEEMAMRVHALAGWHVELYVDSRDLDDLAPLLLRLPAVSIDHLGLSRQGLPLLIRLAERGVRVKATGFGRVGFDVRQALMDIHAANPEALMFGTDLPSTRAPRPYVDEDALLVLETLGEEGGARVLWQNGLAFYGRGAEHAAAREV